MMQKLGASLFLLGYAQSIVSNGVPNEVIMDRDRVDHVHYNIIGPRSVHIHPSYPIGHDLHTKQDKYHTKNPSQIQQALAEAAKKARQREQAKLKPQQDDDILSNFDDAFADLHKDDMIQTKVTQAPKRITRKQPNQFQQALAQAARKARAREQAKLRKDENDDIMTNLDDAFAQLDKNQIQTTQATNSIPISTQTHTNQIQTPQTTRMHAATTLAPHTETTVGTTFGTTVNPSENSVQTAAQRGARQSINHQVNSKVEQQQTKVTYVTRINSYISTYDFNQRRNLVLFATLVSLLTVALYSLILMCFSCCTSKSSQQQDSAQEPYDEQVNDQ